MAKTITITPPKVTSIIVKTPKIRNDRSWIKIRKFFLHSDAAVQVVWVAVRADEEYQNPVFSLRALLWTNLLDVANILLTTDKKGRRLWKRRRLFCKEMNSKPESTISSCNVKFRLFSDFSFPLSSIIQDRSQTCSSSKRLIKEYKSHFRSSLVQSVLYHHFLGSARLNIQTKFALQQNALTFILPLILRNWKNHALLTPFPF
jgi:hypothetical protein